MADAPSFDRRMGAVDALLWSLESDPALRSAITVVVLLDRSPGIDALREHMDRASRLLPRFRHRVAPSPFGIAPPRWEIDPNFELDYHVRSAGAPGGPVDLAALLEVAAPLTTECLDPARPLWRLLLVEGEPGGPAGLVAKLHHAFTDGVGAVRLALALFDLTPEARSGPLPALPDEPAATDIERAWDDVDHELRRGLALARRAVPWVTRSLWETLAAPDERARQVVELVRSVGRVTAPGSQPLSPVMTGRSLRTRLDLLTYSVAELRAAGRAAGGTLNDVFLAAVAGAMRRYHDKHGTRPEHLRLGMAVNRRGEDNAGLIGNVFAPLRLAVPLQITDPAQRVAAIGAMVVAAHGEPVLDLVEGAAALVNHLPAVAAAGAFASALHATDVIASGVPGSPDPLWLAGAKVERLIAFGPRTGAGCNLTLLSHEGVVSVGVNTDPAATPDVDTLMACLHAGFDEVLGLV